MDKRVKPLIRKIRDTPGWRVEETTDGWIAYPPDKAQSGVAIHKSPSDQNWVHMARRLLKKRGLDIDR